MDKIPTINVVIRNKCNWKTLVLVAAAFGIGVLYGKISMAKEQEKEDEVNG